MQSTLLLSASYEPICVIPWKEAIRLFFLDKAEILEEYDLDLRSPSIKMKIPSVVRLVRSFKKPKRDSVKFSRIKVYTRDKFTCQYCLRPGEYKEFTFDHVVPKSRGGKTCWENIVTSCKKCNTKKRDRTPEEANMKLHKEPTRPSWLPGVAITITHKATPDAWKTYLWN